MPAPFGPVIDDLVSSSHCGELGPGKPNEIARPKLAALTISAAFGDHQVTDHAAARCCLSGLWLLHDFLEESHSLSQEIETAEGSYWHGIMHRREPDYGNGKYWFRRVGSHAVFPRLLTEAQELVAAQGARDPAAKKIAGSNAWDPDLFIDWCEQVSRGKATERELAERIAQAEWRLLFEYCHARAIGKRA